MKGKEVLEDIEIIQGTEKLNEQKEGRMEEWVDGWIIRAKDDGEMESLYCKDILSKDPCLER